MTKEEIKELIYNAELDYSKINIKDGRVKGYITVLVNEEEFKELSDIPYFYLDSFEIDKKKYYKESLGVILASDDENYTFHDVEFQFRKEAAWMISYEEALKELEIIKKQAEILKIAVDEFSKDVDEWEQEEILKDLYHTNP